MFLQTFASAMTTFLLSLLTFVSPSGDTLTHHIPDIIITAAKEPVSAGLLPSAVSSISQESLKREGTYRPNALSQTVPGLHIPDYGASLTSTIYIRGIGSRMENPVMGLYIDGIPVLDKNAYDFDWEGINSVTMLRGPQGTLYGRNAMGGVLSLSTLSPTDDSETVINVEYGTAGTVRAGTSLIVGNNALSATYRHTDGYFRNTFKNSNCDPYDGLSLRWRWERHYGERIMMSNLLMSCISREGGFAYGQWKNDTLRPVSYHDKAGYSRLSVIDGYRFRYHGNAMITDATASVQLLADDMLMDQDYTEHSIFTLQQRQLSGAGTLELSLRRADTDAAWQPLTGMFSFYKRNSLHAPVVFRREGIESLILNNANSHIPTDIGYLTISDNEIPVNSDFLIDTWNAALFHESVFNMERWLYTAGLRIDFEGGDMDYDCMTHLLYRFAPIMAADRELSVPYNGSVGHKRIEVIPKLSALFRASDAVIIYSTLSKGYRAGGFNTQIFSDILQNMTMNALMEDLGVHLDRQFVSVSAGNTEYNPETAWNMEAGTRLHKGSVRASLATYCINVHNQQLTVFPPGMSTGRMMTNAGSSRSCGVEAELGWNPGRFRSQISWSWCDARFTRFNDGNSDYSGNRIPYVPEHTLYMSMGYGFAINDKTIEIDASLNGAGPFNWDESGTRQEPFRIRANGRMALVSGRWEFYVRGENLTDKSGRSFYFKSMGNEFFASVKPRIIMTGITIKL